jgi:peptidoglycan/xylan/chitin deacetylase (PgdA/CDA1 family)
MRYILLTFDLEEFDLPKEYNQNIKEKEIYGTSKNGLLELIKILKKYKIKATFFTTTKFAKKYPQIIKELSKEHEIASHGYSHSENINIENLKKSKKEIEKIINKKIKGFRAPRFEINDIKIVSKSGFEYDSSVHPVYLPGRTRKSGGKRQLHKINNLYEIPMSTLPPNFSIFWLAFKNFPLTYSKIFTKINFYFSKYTMLVFHPWEFSNLKKYKIPRYIVGDPRKLLRKLEKYIKYCKKNKYVFKTINDFLKYKNGNKYKTGNF